MVEHPILFLSHSGLDTETARELKRRLLASPEAKAARLEIWFDKDNLLAGRGWQEQLEQVITAGSTAFAVIVGTNGVVNWVDREVRVALSRATEDKSYQFIPVLASSSSLSSLPPFARLFQSVHDPINNETELGKLLRAVLDNGSPDWDGAGHRLPVKLTESPFVGLRAMTEADADLFFGREAELEELVETVRANRLVAIVADSGSGKSSLAQAGLIPRIRGGALEDKSREAPDERVWQVVVIRPGADPVENLRVGVTEAAERLGLSDEARAALRRRIDPSARAEWVYALQCNLPVKATETVLIIDQFEELLTQTQHAKRQPFIDWLTDISLDAAPIPVRVVVTIRADYFNLCSPYTAFYERIKFDAYTPEPGKRLPHFRLKTLTTAVGSSGAAAGSNSHSGLAAVVHRPLILAGHENETERNALLAAIRRDVSDRAGDLALVQMALYETWRKSKAGRESLTTAYNEVGGVAGALAHAAEEVRTSKLTDEEAGLLEAVLVRLVNLGDAGGATRRAARLDEFDTSRRNLAEKLTTEECRRLLLAGSDTIEICHEQLITQWPWWQNWLSSAATDMRLLGRLIQRAADWLGGGQERRHLATGAELDLFKKIADRRKSWLSQAEIAFVAAAALWASIRKIAAILAVLALAFFAAMMTYLYNVAQNERQQATQELTTALGYVSDLVRDVSQYLESGDVRTLAARELMRPAEEAVGKLKEIKQTPDVSDPAIRLLLTISDAYDHLGATEKALSGAELAKSLAKELRVEQPDNPKWKHLLYSSCFRIGDALDKKNLLPQAQQEYEIAFEIAEQLAGRAPINKDHDPQYDLLFIRDKVGDILKRQARPLIGLVLGGGAADLPGALEHYKTNLAAEERLIQIDGSNVKWKERLSATHTRIGQVLEDQHKFAEALTAYRKAAEISEKLALDDPKNQGRKYTLAVRYSRIGTTLQAMTQSDDALNAFQDALAIRKKLVEEDRGNALFGDALASSYSNIGDVRKNADDAIESYQQAVNIIQELWDRDPEDSERKTRLDRVQRKLAAARANSAKVPLESAEPN